MRAKAMGSATQGCASARAKVVNEHNPVLVVIIDHFGNALLVYCVVSRRYKGAVFEMAVPIRVPIAHTTPVAGARPGPADRESVAEILTRCKTSLIADWLTRAKSTPELNHLHLSDEERTRHLPKLVDDLVERLNRSKIAFRDNEAKPSPAAVEHGKLRWAQGYTPAMLIHESRILEVAIFGTLHANLTQLDSSRLLPDVMIIADEVDAQLTHRVETIADASPKSEKAPV